MSNQTSTFSTSLVELGSTLIEPAYRQPADLIYRPTTGKTDTRLISVLNMGGPEDRDPDKRGISQIKAVIDLLENANIICCVMAEVALRYYGARQLVKDWFICVSPQTYEKAVDLVRACEGIQPTMVADTDPHCKLRNVFPRFKFDGLVLYLRVVPGTLYLFDVDANNIERSQTNLPYPKLAPYAQGLLDTFDLGDLTDLVDGMNLSNEWGEENLDLEGTIPVEWAKWKANNIYGREATAMEISGLYFDPPKRRDMWWKIVSPDNKRRRMEPKYPTDIYETRFRRKGQGDPRTYDRDWC